MKKNTGSCRFSEIVPDRRGVFLPLVVFLILGVAAVFPLLINMNETTMQRTQFISEWSRIQWAIEGANQKQLELSSVVVDPYSGVVTTIATFTYPLSGGSFDVAVSISEARTLLARHRNLSATAKAYRNGVDAGYNLQGLAAATVSVPGVAAGGEHSFAWKKDGKLFAWGRNNRGQLGLDTTTDGILPQQVNTGACPSSSMPYYTQGWMVTGGGFHSLALDYFGGVYSWGFNNAGQLGHSTVGANSYVDVPQTVINGGSHMTGVSDLAAGDEFSLALTTSGGVMSWGDDRRGQLGYNPADTIFVTPPDYVASPHTVVSLSGSGALANIVGISAGARHSLAIDRAGNVYAWGDNSYSQLGAAFASAYSRKPIKVNSNVATWVAQIEPSGSTTNPSVSTTFFIPVGHFIASFTTDMNDRYARYLFGFIPIGTDYMTFTHTDGTKTNITPSTRTEISTDRFVWKYETTTSNASLTKPGTYTISIQNSGTTTVYNNKWYRNTNTSSPLENGRGVFSFFGWPIEEPTSFFGIAAGGDFSMAIQRDSSTTKLFTWGRNDYGQLGHGDTAVRNRMSPIANFPPVGERIRTVCAGREHALVLTESGKVYAWGRNNNGQLGLGNTTDRNTPTRVTNTIGSLSITGIAAGGYHSLAIDSNGQVYGWGLQNNGRVGNGSSSGNCLSPVRLTGFP